MSIAIGAIIRYSTLPDITNRSRNLFASGFSYLSFFLAQVYRSVGILPAHHPYILTENVGRYGLRHVIGEGIRCTEFSKKNMDRVAVLFLLMAGLFILFSQIGLLCLSAFMQVAHATVDLDILGGKFLVTPNPDNDIAFVLLDQVFGIPNFFGSCVSTGGTECLVPVEAFPSPFHLAMHALFQFYSIGLLVIAALIFAYFVFTVLAETAESGTPFGKRFNHVWAPIRMVAAIGLLIPISHGLNSAQYITLYAAKFGSSFATNGWFLFVDTAVGGDRGALINNVDSTLEGDSSCALASEAPSGDSATHYASLVACPNRPPLNVLMEFFTAVATCYRGMEYRFTGDNAIPIEGYLVRSGDSAAGNNAVPLAGFSSGEIDADIESAIGFLDAALEFTGGQDIEIVFGHKAEAPEDDETSRDLDRRDYKGGVIPYCGKIKVQVPSSDKEVSPGAYGLTAGYLALVGLAWEENTKGFNTCMELAGIPFGNIARCMVERYMMGAAAGSSYSDPIANWTEILTEERIEWYEKYLDAIVAQAIVLQAQSGAWMNDLKKFGWAGAGIWYNKIAQLNGTLFASVYTQPIPLEYPLLMEEVRRKKRAQDEGVTGPERFQPSVAGGDIELEDAGSRPLAIAMYQSQKVWADSYTAQEPTGNVIIDSIQALLGLDGLFNMRDNIERGVHPLAALSGIGRSLIESSLRTFGASVYSGLFGGLMNATEEGKSMGAIMTQFSGFMMSIGGLGLTIGFVLFYVIPFMPFLYFFFAVGGWVKGLFEAMVGVPLWALAHIRIDGNGLAGDAAMQGYYLILEIFLRPILIIFGLLAGMVIFSAQMTILNQIWDVVTSNVAGFDSEGSFGAGESGLGSPGFFRSHIDQFFYTIMYAVIGYMMALASFKMVDQIPNHIMRWMGANVSTFGDQAEDAGQGLVRSTYFGADIASGSVREGIQGGGQAVRGGAQIAGGLFGRNNSDPTAR